jgi:hypothetical protein
MPVEDRIVLFYGALSLAWGAIGRNPEEAARCRALFDNKLARMMGKIQDSQDKPRIEPDSIYIQAKKGSRIFGRRNSTAGSASASYTAPSYLESVTINGGTFTGNMTASAGITIDGRDIGADGALTDAHIAASAGVHGIGASSSVVGTGTAQALTNKTVDVSANTFTNILDINIGSAAAITRSKIAVGTASRVLVNDGSGAMSESSVTSTELEFLTSTESLTSATLADNTASAADVATWAHASFDSITINYSIKRGTANKETGQILIATDGTSASIAQSASSLGTLGVTFTVDVSGSDLRLRYVTTSTGTAATMKYKLSKWIS